jgi:hypothetical protein
MKMSRRIQSTLFLVLLTITALACGLENIQIVEAPNLELTITAQALVLLQQTGQAPTATPTTVSSIANPPAANATNPPPANNADSAAAGPVTVTVSAETNCRKGPGVIYASVYSLPVGQVAEVVGKNTITNYWIIKIPGSNSTCWLWGKYATVSGNTAALAEFATFTPGPPTATIKPTLVPATATTQPSVTRPNSPTITTSSVICDPQGGGNTKYTINVNWVDNSTDETIFNVYPIPSNSQYGVQPNVTTVNFVQILPTGTTLTVKVTAGNSAGESQASTTTFVCQ